MIERASVVLPHPDSPASARISPSSSVRFTPSTARAMSCAFFRPRARPRPANRTWRSRTCSNGAAAGTSPIGSRATWLTRHLPVPVSTGSTRRHAARRPSPAGNSGGSSLGQRSNASAHRGWKLQPLGTSRGSGGSPSRPVGAWMYRSSPICGNAPARAVVYGCRGSRKTSVGGTLLHDASRVHHREPLAHLGQDREVVRDEQHREPELILQLLQEPQDLRLHHHVERGRRLVGDHQVRLARERHRDHHALLLPAGELVREVPRASRRQADELQQLARAQQTPRAVSPDRAPGSARRSDRPPGSPGRAHVARPGR